MRLREYAKERGRDVADVSTAAEALGFDSAHQASTITDAEAAALDRHFAERASEPPVESPDETDPRAEETSPVAEEPVAPPQPEELVPQPEHTAAESSNEPADLLDRAARALSGAGQISFSKLAALLVADGWRPPSGMDAARHVRTAVLRDVWRNPATRFRHAAKRLVRLT